VKNLLTISFVILFPGLVAAQSTSLFPSSGGSGSSSSSGRSSSSSSGGSSFGSSSGQGQTGASGSQSFGGSGSGGGQSGSGTSTFGTGELGSPQFTQFGQAGTAVLESGFVGAGEAGTFIGVQQPTTGQSQGQQFNQGNFQSLQGFGNQNQGNGQSQGRSTSSSGRSRTARLQPVVRISFAYAPIAPETVQARIDTEIAEYEFGVEGLSYSLDADGVLTLTGVAESEQVSRTLATFLSFEPGVRRVDNQLIVNQ
jgi:hypothetical protein